jgi:hypothetical protein
MDPEALRSMDALSRTIQLYKESFVVLTKDSEILLFPVLSGISAASLAAAAFYTFYHDGTLLAVAHRTAGWENYAALFAWYYLNNFLIVFFNSALIGCARIRLSGGDATIGQGFGMALDRMAHIALWALVASTVGVILQSFNNRRGGLLTRLIGAALSIGWTMMTYLIVPVLVIENRGVLDSIYRSSELFKKQWGEELLGSFGFGLLNFLLFLPAIGLGAFICRYDLVAGLIVVVVYALFQATISSAVAGVFRAALYQFATSGEAPPGFTAAALDPRDGPLARSFRAD